MRAHADGAGFRLNYYLRTQDGDGAQQAERKNCAHNPSEAQHFTKVGERILNKNNRQQNQNNRQIVSSIIQRISRVGR